jgi:hypothetical protein
VAPSDSKHTDRALCPGPMHGLLRSRSGNGAEGVWKGCDRGLGGVTQLHTALSGSVCPALCLAYGLRTEAAARAQRLCGLPPSVRRRPQQVQAP